MRGFIFALALLIGCPALAQQAPQSPEVQACQSKLLETISRDLEVRTELFALQKRISELEGQLRKEQPK